MQNQNKHDRILDALQTLLRTRSLQTISVSEIAQAAEIGKGSIYYYFPSKDSIFEALIERSYEEPLNTAKELANQDRHFPFYPHGNDLSGLPQLFQRISAFGKQRLAGRPGKAFLHQRYISHIVSELKPVLAEIIRQGIRQGDIHFDRPEALAEIVLIVLTIKLDNSIVEASMEEVKDTIAGLITLLEKGTENPPGSLNFSWP